MFLYYFFDLFAFLLYKATLGLQRDIQRLRTPCVINISEYPKSTNRDVVFLYATSFAGGLVLTIKSLRTTQSNCRIVLFWGSRFITTRVREFCNHFKVELIPNCFSTGSRKFVAHMIRYEYEMNWLRNHINEVDRVLHTDAYDVFFQGDPFSRHIHNDQLTFVVEPHCFRSCGWNLGWMQNCYGSEYQRFYHNFIICSGSIGGSASQYLKLLEFMTSRNEWAKCWSESLDQAILNYLVWTGGVSNLGINYSFTGCDGGFLTVQWCAIEEKLRENEHNQIVSVQGTIPSYIHQYNRLPEYTNKFYRMCGI